MFVFYMLTIICRRLHLIWSFFPVSHVSTSFLPTQTIFRSSLTWARKFVMRHKKEGYILSSWPLNTCTIVTLGQWPIGKEKLIVFSAAPLLRETGNSVPTQDYNRERQTTAKTKRRPLWPVCEGRELCDAGTGEELPLARPWDGIRQAEARRTWNSSVGVGLWDWWPVGRGEPTRGRLAHDGPMTCSITGTNARRLRLHCLPSADLCVSRDPIMSVLSSLLPWPHQPRQTAALRLVLSH